VVKLGDAIITAHAAEQMAKRQIAQREVLQLLASATEASPVRPGRVVVQGKVGGYLLRVFVDVDRTPPEVVTVYRTSKMDKYRSEP